MVSRPHLDHAILGEREWHWHKGGWLQWNDRQAEWLRSEAPPAEAERFNYRQWVLGK